ncbi:hypothetical protein HDU86_007966 [Geranomyces michiganensis]|nr:hypothetical protein HDU86_007966 [Geranomyces michiganensis]
MNAGYCMPLKADQPDDAGKPRLSRTISEGNLADKESMGYQLMEQATRRRVAEVEESVRRQYDERYGVLLAAQGGPNEFTSEAASIPPVVHRRLIELQREVAILQTELSVQHRANRNLRREASHDRETMEGKAAVEADDTRSRGSQSARADSRSAFAHARNYLKHLLTGSSIALHLFQNRLITETWAIDPRTSSVP